MRSDVDWETLKKAAGGRPGAVHRRVASTPRHDVFIAVEQPGERPALWLEVDSADVDPELDWPSLEAMEVQFIGLGGDRTRCAVALHSSDLEEVFSALVADAVTHVAATEDDEGGVAALHSRLVRWSRLMERGAGTGLTSSERRGLVGELLLLKDFWLPRVAPVEALRAWTGPEMAHQDFQSPSVAIEVKATAAKRPQALTINSERELDDQGCEVLVLAHVSLDERRGGTGSSLHDKVTAVRDVLAVSPLARQQFDEKLLSLGYLPHHEGLYREPRYTLREMNLYRVADAFPRIVEKDLRDGVGNVTYRLLVSACQEHRISEESLIELIGEGD